MSLAIRICLIVGSFFSLLYMLRRIRKAQVQIEYTIFWMIFSILLLVLSLFPEIAMAASYLLGFQAPINFVYLVIIAVLIANQFLMTVRMSQLDNKVRKLAQRVALNEEKIEREKDL